MLWLALLLPGLPLEIHARSTGADTPLAVAEESGSGQKLIQCDSRASALGVRPGMSAASAWGLCATLKILPRNSTAERNALEHIAAWATQFTSKVSLAGPAELLLEIGSSLNLFEGLDALLGRLQAGLCELGYEACHACAPTPLAAQWLARSNATERIILQQQDIAGALEALPITVMQLPAASITALERFGIRTIGNCLQFPRDGLAHRIGPSVLEQLDRASGQKADPRPLYMAPLTFSHTLTLPAPVMHAEAMLFAARRLIAELCGHLSAIGQGAERLDFTLLHEHRQRTRFALELVAASRHADHLLTLLRERLSNLELPQPAIAIRLTCTRSQPLDPSSQPMLPDDRVQSEAAIRLLEKLQTRLGSDVVRGLRQFADHRPERAWTSCPPGNDATESTPKSSGLRPLWLLPQPQLLHEDGTVPCLDGPLTLLAGPERIESGWWDGQPVARDYFVACDPKQAVLWIYRERNAGARWFLQGLFA